MSFWTEVLRPVIKVVIAAVAAYAGYYQLAAAMLAAGVADHQTTRAKKRARDAYNAAQRDRQQMVASATNPRQDVYGNVVVSGTVLLKHSAGAKKEYLYIAVELARHEIDAIESVWIGDTEITGWDASGDMTSGPFLRSIAEPGQASRNGAGTITVTHPTQPGLASPIASIVSAIRRTATGDVNITGQVSVSGSTITITGSLGTDLITVIWRWAGGTSLVRVYTALGSPTQTAFSAWQAEIGDKWTSAHRLRGRAAVGLRLQYDQDVFGQLGGINIKARVRGKKLFDPRSGLTVYSNNAALITADVLRTRMGVTAAQIPAAELSAEADLCDALVATNQLGGTQARYTCNIPISTAVTPRDSLDLALETMAGSAVWVQGRWLIRCGAWRTPDITLTAADLADGPRHVVPRADRRSLVNSVVATYAEPSLNWVLNPAPAVTSSYYLAQDAGRSLPMQISLEGVTDSIRAQRLAKIELEKARNGATFTARFSANAYDCVPGGIYYLQIDRYFGATPKAYTVLDRKIDLRTLEIDLVLREVAAGIWDWNGGMPTQVDLTPNTSLPNPLAQPEVLASVTITSGNSTMLMLSDGTILARARVSWTQHTSAFVTSGGYIEIEWRPVVGSTTWISTPQIAGDATSALIGPIDDLAAVLIRVRAVNAASRASPWTMQTHIVAGKSAAPTAPTALTVTESAGAQRIYTLTHAQDIDHAAYLVRYSPVLGATFDQMTLVAAYWSGAGKTGESTVPADGTWRFAAVAIDTSGNQSAPVYSINALVGIGLLATGELHSGNLLDNSTFGGKIISPWTCSGTPAFFGTETQRDTAQPYAPLGMDALVVRQAGVLAGGDAVVAADVVPAFLAVTPGTRMELSVYLAAHRCAVQLILEWFTASLAPISSVTWVGAVPMGGQQLVQWERAALFGTVPATAAYCRPILRKLNTQTGQPDSYAWMLAPYLGIAGAEQVTPSPYTPSVGAALAQASSASLSAASASTAAAAAAATASAAMTRIQAIDSDGVLARGEKAGVIVDWAELWNSRNGIVASAGAAGVSSTAFTNSLTALANHLTALSPAWNDTTQDTTITPATWRSDWDTAYQARTALQNAIAAQIKGLADTAQQAANGAALAASNAATAANQANTAIADINADNKWSPIEKAALVVDWAEVNGSVGPLVAQANTFGITAERDAFTAAINALAVYLSSLSPGWNDTSTTTTIVRTTADAKWADAYNTRATLTAKIADEAGKRASWLTVSDRPREQANLCWNGAGPTLTGWSAGVTVQDLGVGGYWATNMGLTGSRYALTFQQRDSTFGDVFAVRKDEVFSFSADCVHSGAATGGYATSIGLILYKPDGSVLSFYPAATLPSATISASLSGAITIPAGAAAAAIWVAIDGYSNFTDPGKGAHYTNIVVRRAATTMDIVAGAATQVYYTENTFDYTPAAVPGGGNSIGSSGLINIPSSSGDKFELFFTLKNFGVKSGNVDNTDIQIYITHTNSVSPAVPDYTRFRHKPIVNTVGVYTPQSDYEKSLIIDWIPPGVAMFYVSLVWGAGAHYPYSDNDASGTIYMRVTRIKR